MTKARAVTQSIRSAEQWRVLTSPSRIEIVEFMRAAAPCSVAELAARMDRPADALYHHLRKLEGIGVVRVVEHRRQGRQTEAVYDLAAERLVFDYDAKTGRGGERLADVAASILRSTERTYREAVTAGGETGSGEKKSLWSRIETGWLTEEGLAEVNAHLEAIDEILERGRKGREGRLFTLTVFLAPAVRRRRGDGGTEGGKARVTAGLKAKAGGSRRGTQESK